MVPNKERSDGHILTQHLLLNERFPQFFSCFTSNPSSLINYTTSKLYPPPPSHLHRMPTILLISYLDVLKSLFFFFFWSCCFHFCSLSICSLYSIRWYHQSLKILQGLPIGLKRKYELHYLAYKALNDHSLILQLHCTTVSNFLINFGHWSSMNSWKFLISFHLRHLLLLFLEYFSHYSLYGRLFLSL